MVKRVYAPKPSKKSFKKRKVTKNVRETGIVSKNNSVLGKLARYLPFPAQRKYTFQYDSTLINVAGLSTVQALINANSLFDVDANTAAYFGNKTPTNYSKLLSSTGPYKVYRVDSWECEYTIVNKSTSSLGVYVIGASANSTDWDTSTEAANYPGAKHYVITGTSGTKNILTMMTTGCVADVNGYPLDVGLSAAYNASPTTIIGGGMLIYSSDGTNTLFDISCRIRQRALLTDYDGN